MNFFLYISMRLDLKGFRCTDLGKYLIFYEFSNLYPIFSEIAFTNSKQCLMSIEVMYVFYFVFLIPHF